MPDPTSSFLHESLKAFASSRRGKLLHIESKFRLKKRKRKEKKQTQKTKHQPNKIKPPKKAQVVFQLSAG